MVTSDDRRQALRAKLSDLLTREPAGFQAGVERLTEEFDLSDTRVVAAPTDDGERPDEQVPTASDGQVPTASDGQVPTASHERVPTAPDERVTTTPESVDLPVATDCHERRLRLCWRAWTLAAVPLGITLTGPAYHDNPVVYATPRVRALTGYTNAQLRGQNLRRLQGPATEQSAVDALRDAIRSWEPVTVELTNYRRDGSRFRNRLTLCPVPAADGTIAHWFGLQREVVSR